MELAFEPKESDVRASLPPDCQVSIHQALDNAYLLSSYYIKPDSWNPPNSKTYMTFAWNITFDKLLFSLNLRKPCEMRILYFLEERIDPPKD